MNTISHLQSVAGSEGIECWLFYCVEESDPYFKRHITKGTTVPAVAIVTPTSTLVVAHSLDIHNVASHLNVVEFHSRSELWTIIEGELKRLQFPKQIALNYSTLSDAGIDILGHGLYVHLEEKLRTLYSANCASLELVSAERALYALIERRSPTDIARMRIAAQRAHELIEHAFRNIVPGMTERELMLLIQQSMQIRPDYFSTSGVVSEKLAWEEESCPVVLAGPNLVLGGHTSPGTAQLRRGDTVYCDFGVTLTFDDDTAWSSDIQRMGYLLREHEQEAPEAVRRVFSVLIEAIDTGITHLRPGTPGHEVDSLVRNCITHAGYPSYNHATGHPIGQSPHNPGTLLGQDGARSQLQVQPNAVYTIEPRIAIENGGSIEEMVLATPEGGLVLSPRQTTLYLIQT